MYRKAKVPQDAGVHAESKNSRGVLLHAVAYYYATTCVPLSIVVLVTHFAKYVIQHVLQQAYGGL